MVKTRLSKPPYRILDPKNFYNDMRKDVKLLREHKAHMSLTTVILCCLDALAAGSGKAEKPKFVRFVTRNFPDLCKRLKEVSPAKKEVGPGKRKGALVKREGARVLYEEYRNGFVHRRAPNPKFGMKEEDELPGGYAEEADMGTGLCVWLNVHRLSDEFLALVDRLEKDAT